MQPRIIGLVSFVLLLFPAFAHADGGTLVVTYVLPAGDFESAETPIPGAVVTVSTDPTMGPGRYGLRTAITDSAGKAIFPGLPSDDYWFEIQLDGFLARQWRVDVHAHSTRRVTAEAELATIECTLGQFWDFRTQLDPGTAAGLTIFRLESPPR